MPASDQHTADLDSGIDRSMTPEFGMHLGHEKDPEPVILTAREGFMWKLLASQQANVNRFAGILDCIGHQIAPVLRYRRRLIFDQGELSLAPSTADASPRNS